MRLANEPTLCRYVSAPTPTPTRQQGISLVAPSTMARLSVFSLLAALLVALVFVFAGSAKAAKGPVITNKVFFDIEQDGQPFSAAS